MNQPGRNGRGWRVVVPLFLLLLLSIGISAGAALARAPEQASGQGKQAAPPNTSSGVSSAKLNLSDPVAPRVILYDQYNNPANYDITSQDFEAANDAYDAQAADDFVVPAGVSWNITEVDVDGEYSAGGGPAAGFNVYFYSNSGTLPGTEVYSALSQSFTGSAGDAVITLSSPAVLTPGTYWVSVQARQDFTPYGQWYWQNRSVQSGSASAWRNPGGGFGVGCTDWGVKTTCITSQQGPDQVYRLVGLSMPQETPTPGPSPTQTPTPGCTPQPAGWVSGPVHPASPGIIRAVGAYFPANGKFYTVGGRTSDSAGSDTTNPYEYSPATNTWATKAWTYPDTEVNNMACAVLTVSSTPYIYCVGGSAAGGTTATARVFRYDPVADTGSVVTGDEWPGNASGDILPGGFAVYNNKMYVMGGFQINIGMIADTWVYDPNGATHWTHLDNMPYPLGYVPAATIGSYIYTAGGSDWDGTTLIDSASTYRYDPATNTWDDAAIADLPQYTAETRALNYEGKLWVMGGGRTAPNPSNVVQAWDPATNTWSTPTSFVEARRNFPVDTDGMYIWLAGGYAPSSATNTMEIYHPATSCETPTPVPPTNTPTHTPVPATETPVPPTPCTITFSDVPPENTFYPYVRCLACRGVLGGYSDGTYRPNNNITRGQIAKVVSNAAHFNDPIPQDRQTYTDVPSTNTFWEWIERLTIHGVMSGYTCGGVGEPCDPQNRPYFRWANNATRAQLAKIDSNAAGYIDNPTTQTFTDVPTSHPFYIWIERLATRGIMGGYQCGGVGEPCDPQNRPYFRPYNNVTRGQAAKIVANTFYPNCQTPR